LAGSDPAKKVAEGGTGVRATTFPASIDVIPFRDQVSGTPEVEVRKSLSKLGHEGFNVVAATTRFVSSNIQLISVPETNVDNETLCVLSA
jgi:hypothetical protein